MEYIKMLLFENKELSLTRTLSCIGFLAFLLVSFYLAYFGVQWNDYNTFANLTGGGGLVSQGWNKLVNSKYNSESGSYNQRKGAE